MPDNYRTARRKLREDYQPNITEINKKIIELKSEIGDLKIKLVETGVDVGPVIYIARAFNTDVDSVVKFFILVLIFVFDPMAVLFVISYNVTLLNQEQSRSNTNITVRKKNKWWELYGEKKKEIIDKEFDQIIPVEQESIEDDLQTNVAKKIGRGGIKGK